MSKKFKIISKQEFYEKSILKSYENYHNTKIEREVELMNYDIPKTFEGLMIKRDLLGLKRLPDKENFDKWGFEYIIQLLYWVPLCHDDDFMFDFMSLLYSNDGIVDFESEDSISVFYDVFYEFFLTDKTYAEYIGDFILRKFPKSDIHKKVFSLVRGTGLTDMDIGELIGIGRQCGYV